MAGRWDELADELAAGAQERFVADLTERFVAMLAEGVGNPDMLALYTRAVAESEALRVWAAHEAGVSAEVRAAFEEAMAEEDAAATRPLEGFGALADAAGAAALSNRARARAGTAARQLAKIIARQNVALCGTAARAWWGAVADAVVSVQAGGSRAEAMERACRAMADAGVETVDYLTGRRTAVDAAVRRHVVTQQAQCRAESLDDAMDAWGLDLVYVTAHYGARPDHAAWQGRVYSRHGITPGYPALAEATGYGTPGGLCGCNCRHRFHPYVPGESRLPDTGFESQRARFGMTSDEYYEATQRQRALERSVREAKRRVAVGAAQGLEMTSDRYLLGVRQARLAAHVRASGLTRDYARERAYGVGGQPRALKRDPSGGYSASSIMTRAGFARAKWKHWREYGAVYDESGRLVSDVFVGDGGHVVFDVPSGYRWKDKRVSHTHPGEVGGTFSAADIYHLTDGDLRSYDAVCMEGRYVIERVGEQAESARSDFYKAFSRNYEVLQDGYYRLESEYLLSGRDPYDDDSEEFKRELFGEVSGGSDAWLSENALKYGYRYSFKKRGK